MDRLDLQISDLKTLRPFDSSNKISNAFGVFYHLDKEYSKRYNGKKMLLKYDNDKQSIKEKTINLENLYNSKLYDVKELVIPEKLAYIENKCIGYILPLIEGVNLGDYLYDDKININDKLKHLKQLCLLVDKVHKIKTKYGNFIFTDLHPGNFVIDNEDNSLKAIDLDSGTFHKDKVFSKKYLIDKNCNITANKNIDLLMLNTIVINFIAKTRIDLFNDEQKNKYYDYLQSIGISKKIINYFKAVSSDYLKNVNPLTYLDELSSNKNIAKANIMLYNLRKQ